MSKPQTNSQLVRSQVNPQPTDLSLDEMIVGTDAVLAVNQASKDLVDGVGYRMNEGRTRSIEMVTYHNSRPNEREFVGLVRCDTGIVQMPEGSLDRHQPLVAELEGRGLDIAIDG